MKFFTVLVFLCGALFSTEGDIVSLKNGRIIGGEPAYISQYNFAAAINVQTANSRFFCGGAVFKPQWILTAGQCVDGAVLFTIRLGSDKLEGDDPNRLTLATSEYVLHPDFNPLTLENDVGLIKLRMAIEYTDYIRPIAPLGMHHLPEKSGLRAIGWGQTSDTNSSLSNHLQVTQVSSLSHEWCRIIYGNQLAETMVCVEGNYNEGACHGDTGSPLLDAYSKYTNIHVGIASFFSSNGCESMDPTGYTRTYSYSSWINNVTQQM